MPYFIHKVYNTLMKWVSNTFSANLNISIKKPFDKPRRLC